MRIVLSLVLLLATAAGASATPISYTDTGFGSGTLNGVAFGGAAPLAFTITALGDTANRLSCGGACLSNDNTSASITITGLGTFAFVTPTRFFANVGIVGFSRAGVGGADLFDGPNIPAWDMLTSLGPIAGTGTLLQWGNAPVVTSGGTLVFNNGSSAATFTATVGPQSTVPEPATLLLLGSGLVATSLRQRLKKRA